MRSLMDLILAKLLIGKEGGQEEKSSTIFPQNLVTATIMMIFNCPYDLNSKSFLKPSSARWDYARTDIRCYARYFKPDLC